MTKETPASAARARTRLRACRISQLSRAGRRRLSGARGCQPPARVVLGQPARPLRDASPQARRPERAHGGGQDANTYVANERYKNVPGAVLRLGNLPAMINADVHSGEDVILTATGPGSERVRGQMDNTEVFRVIAEALDSWEIRHARIRVRARAAAAEGFLGHVVVDRTRKEPDWMVVVGDDQDTSIVAMRRTAQSRGKPGPHCRA